MVSVIDIIPNDIKHIIDRIKYDEVLAEFRNTWIKRWSHDHECYIYANLSGSYIALVQWRNLSTRNLGKTNSIYRFTAIIQGKDRRTGVYLPKRY